MKFIHLTKKREREIEDPGVYDDDTIDMVCVKLARKLSCTANDIYLFSKQKRSYTSRQLFDLLIKPFGDIP